MRVNPQTEPTPMQKRIFAVIKSRMDGASMAVLSEYFGLTVDGALPKHVRALEVLGMIAASHPAGSRHRVYAIPESIERIRNASGRATTRALRERKRAERLARLAARPKKDPNAPKERKMQNDGFRHIRVCATQAAPLRPMGPNSVFSLGAI